MFLFLIPMSPSIVEELSDPYDPESDFILYSDDPVTIKKNYKQLISLFHPDKTNYTDTEVQQRLVDKIQKAGELSDPMENKMHKFGIHKEYKSLQSQPVDESALILKSQMTSVYDILERIKENSIVEALNDFNIQDTWPIVSELTLGADVSNGFRWNRIGTNLTWQYSINGYSYYLNPSTGIKYKNPLAIKSTMFKIKQDYPDASFVYSNKIYLVHTPRHVAMLPTYTFDCTVPVGIKTTFKGCKLDLSTTLFKKSLQLMIEKPFKYIHMQSTVLIQPSSMQVGISAFKPINGRIFTLGLNVVAGLRSIALEEDNAKGAEEDQEIDDEQQEENELDTDDLNEELSVETMVSIMPVLSVGFYPEKHGLGMNISNQNVAANYTIVLTEWAKMRLFASLGGITEFGWRISVSITRILRVTFGIQGDLSNGTAIMAGFKYYNQKFSLPIMLLSHPSINLVTTSSACVFLTYGLLHKWFIKSKLEKIKNEKLKVKLEEFEAEILHKKQEAEYACSRMESGASKSKETEMQCNGLVIINAKYGTSDEYCDVTIPLQYFIKNSALELPSLSKVIFLFI
eukprot:NODE_407_length_9242_cov_0.441868.p1 type:complete len:571 gc:universal NODE_407_length_9242_cov_0.441868:7091-8803(+)